MTPWQNEDEDDLDENQDPDEWDQDADDDSSDTLPCPHCGRDIYEDAQLCPYCGRYVTMDAVWHRKAWWLIIAAVLALLAVFTWVLS